jgi:hypothetical protein
MEPIKTYMYTPEEIQLAHDIAEQLQDPAALSQFLRFTKEVPHELLREYLFRACATPDHRVRVSRAAIFVNSVKNYKQYGKQW